jgi:hypothetical protein
MTKRTDELGSDELFFERSERAGFQIKPGMTIREFSIRQPVDSNDKMRDRLEMGGFFVESLLSGMTKIKDYARLDSWKKELYSLWQRRLAICKTLPCGRLKY